MEEKNAGGKVSLSKDAVIYVRATEDYEELFHEIKTKRAVLVSFKKGQIFKGERLDSIGARSNVGLGRWSTTISPFEELHGLDLILAIGQRKDIQELP
jgi:hypothetical protein